MVSHDELNGGHSGSAPKTNNGNTNGNSSTSSSIDSENSVDYDSNDKSTTIRVGVEYQADLHNYTMQKNPKLENLKEKEMLVWKPNSKISDEDLESFLFAACSKCSYTIEQALALLCFNKYDIQESLENTQQYVPTPNKWTDEDKILFEQAYNYHGKNFYKIKQCLPDKSQACLVNFYYMWKKTRTNVSHIQQQTEQQSGKATSISSMLNNVNDDSQQADRDNDFNGPQQSNENDADESNFTSITKICSNCDLITDDLQSTPKGVLCNACYSYYKNTSGLMRPDNLNIINGALNSDQSDNDLFNKRTQNAKEARNFQKSLRKPPKGIYLNYDELVNLAEFDSNIIFDMLDKRLFSLKQEVQSNKQSITSMIGELANEDDKNGVIEIDHELLKALESKSVATPAWTPHEISLVIQSFNKYGTDFNAISQVLGSKSESSIKAFYQYHKENYNLEKLITNPMDIKTESLAIFNDLSQLNRPELPTTNKVDSMDSKPEENLLNSNDLTNNIVI